MNLEADPCPVILWDDCSPVDTLVKHREIPEAKGIQLSHAWILNPQLWDDKYSFKLQNVGVICYIEVGNTKSLLRLIKNTSQWFLPSPLPMDSSPPLLTTASIIKLENKI